MAQLVGFTSYAGITRIRYEGPGGLSSSTSQPESASSAPVIFHSLCGCVYCSGRGGPCQVGWANGRKYGV